MAVASRSSGLAFVRHVRETLAFEPEKFNGFAMVMHDYKSGAVDSEVLKEKVEKLFQGHGSLIVGINAYLPEQHRIVVPDDDQVVIKLKASIDFVNKVRARFDNRDDHGRRAFKSFLDAVKYCRENIGKVAQLNRKVSALFRDHPDLQREFTDYFLPDSNVSVTPRTPELRENQDRGRRRRRRRSVVKEDWAEYEDSLYDLDMAESAVKSAFEKVERLLELLAEDSRRPILVDDHFTALNFGFIRRLYGNKGPEMIEAFRRNPQLVLPILNRRLGQKKDEIERSRVEFRKTLSQYYANC